MAAYRGYVILLGADELFTMIHEARKAGID